MPTVKFLCKGWHLIAFVLLLRCTMSCIFILCLQYLSQCDVVLYMKSGKIAERGTYEELIRNNGVTALFFILKY